MSSHVTRPRAALVALAILLGLLVPTTGLVAEPASAAVVPSTELLVNGSFEIGDFTGWGTKDAADPCCRPLAVLAAPDVVPTDGLYAVGQGFDGCGPDTIEFWQDVAIPAALSATLTFDWEVPSVRNSGSMDRTFDVVVEPGGGGASLMSTNIYTAASGFIGSAGPVSSVIDMSAYVDSTIRVKFFTTIPECFTGPGNLQVDNISLSATVDTEAPVITLTGANPQTVEVFSAYTESGATVSDNVDTDLTAEIDAGAVNTSLLGEYSVTYDATDSSGNVADQVIRIVEVVDTEAPVISLVGGTVTVGLGSTYTDPGASAVDNYDSGLAVTIDASDVDTSVVGSYDVRFDVSDSSGNAATQLLRTVNVVDTTSPIITLIGGTQIIEFPAPYTERGATVSDNYDTDLVAVIDSSEVDTSMLGTYIVTYDATDSSGNAATQLLRTVRVVDTTRPVITLTGDDPQTIQVDDAYEELGATATDNHDTGLTVVADASGVDTTMVGSYSVFYSVTDAQGNMAATVTRTVNVVDTEAPVITLVGDDPQVIEVGDAYSELGATVSDNYDDGLTATADASAVDTATVGSYSVTYDATDSGGNAALQVTRTVNVVDTEAPVITLTGDPVVTVEVHGTYTESGATATDNYDTSLTVVIDDSALDTGVVGEYTITYDVSDSSDNAATQVTRTVDVVDTESPVITLIGGTPDGTQTIGVFQPYTELGALVSDNYDTDLAAVIDSSAVDTSVVGSYTVLYDATDSSGNAADQVARTVNVIDNGFPVITLNGDAEVIIEVGSAYADEGAVANDVADGPLTTFIVTVNPVDPDVVAVYTVTYNVTDSDGNAATQVTRTVNVVDTTVPVITLVGDNPQVIEVHEAYAELGANVSDNYDAGLSAVIDASDVDVDVVGEYTVTYDVTDANGNAAAQVTRTVSVVDTTAPVITLSGDNPQIIEVWGTYVEAGASVSDNYDTGLSAVIDATAVYTEVTGTYAVTYNVTDANGNVATQVTRTVRVVDTTPPVISLLGDNPQIIEVGTAYTELGSTVSDNYSNGLVATADASDVDTDTVDSYTVTYDVTDTSGNAAAQVSRTVHVVDTTAPVISLVGHNPQVIEVGDTYSELGADVSDNYDTGLSAVIDATDVDTDVVGEYTVTYDATDATGNAAAQVTRTVDVVDTTAPVITLIGANPMTIEVGSGYADAGATASDIGDGDLTGAIVTDDPVDPDVIGVYTVTYNVTDTSLNAAVEVTRTVNVVDTTAPLVTLIGADTVTVEVGSAYVDAGATAVDLVDGDLTSSIVATNPVNTDLVGVYVIEYDVSDLHGNPATTVTRTVNVVDTTAPVISLTGDNPQVIELGSAYVELGATATDNYDLGSSGIVIDATAVDTSKVGSYTVTYDVTDANLNAAVTVECTVSVVKAFVSNVFIDDDASLFEADIDWLANSGITLGCNPPINDLFCPNGSVTRGQMAAFLHRALPNLPEVRPAVDFADDDGSVFEADIEWLYSRGITDGTSATTFSPGATVTRGQMAAFLHRALPNLPEVRSAVDFADDDGSVFEADIEWLYSRGITEGTSATTFGPTGPVTRGHMAAFLHRALG